MKQLSDFPDAHLRIFDRPEIPPPDQIKTVYLIGICGTGMGSLAGLFAEAGFEVRGSDKAAYPPMSDRLRAMGIQVHEGYQTSHLDPSPDLVIVGNACIPTHTEAAYAREQLLPQQSFPEALAHFFIRERKSLVLAGTHGKTTTTGLLAHVFSSSGRDPGYLVGGVMANTGTSYHIGSGDYFIVEGDEYDSAYFDKRPKFMHYRPHIAVVTSLEFDHADIYDDIDDYRQAFERFVEIVNPGGLVLLCGEDPEVEHLAHHCPAESWTYGTHQNCDVRAENINFERRTFDLYLNEERLGVMPLPLAGKHNLLNTLAVCGISLREKVTADEIAEGLASFKGLKRRMEVRGIIHDVVVVDDFAHHPTAVRETISAARVQWPDRKLLAVFEPRSNSSRRKIFESAYGDAFLQADHVFLSTPPLRHNDNPDDFMDVAYVASKLKEAGIPIDLAKNADELLPVLVDNVSPGDVVLIMSNGGFGGIHGRLLDSLTLSSRA